MEASQIVEAQETLETQETQHIMPQALPLWQRTRSPESAHAAGWWLPSPIDRVAKVEHDARRTIDRFFALLSKRARCAIGLLR